MHAMVCSSSSHSPMLVDHDGLRDSSLPITLGPSQSISWSSLCTWAATLLFIYKLPDCLFVFTDSLLQCPASFSYVQFLTVFARNFIDDSFPPVFGYPILDSHQHLSDCSAWFEYCSHVYTLDRPAYIVNLLRQAPYVWHTEGPVLSVAFVVLIGAGSGLVGCVYSVKDGI